MKLLFLDIDGVLNNHDFDHFAMCGRIHYDKIILLNQILDATKAKVILTSAWRYIIHRNESTLVGMDWLLRSHGMRSGHLLDITRLDTMVERPARGYDGKPESWPQTNERGNQISDYLKSSSIRIASYVALDDLDLGISEAGHPFVQTDATVGLTYKEVSQCIEHLMKGG